MNRLGTAWMSILVFGIGSLPWNQPVWPGEPEGWQEGAGDSVSVWIDTDPACGQGATNDVDDCWALLQAFRSPELSILGISTVFGNTDGHTAFTTATSVVQRLSGDKEASEMPPVFLGARGPEDRNDDIDTEATAALAEALRQSRVTIIALGPLTNIAAVLKRHPDRTAGIRGIVAVAGKRPDQGWFYPGSSRFLHFHDFNFRKDPAAFDVVLNSGIPLTLIPFELATKVMIRRSDLDTLLTSGAQAKWLADTSADWMGHWERRLGSDGFHPFDALAVGYVAMPDLFRCEALPAEIRWKRSRFVIRDELEVSRDLTTPTTATYCFDVDPRFKVRLMERLMAKQPPDVVVREEGGGAHGSQ